MITMKGFSSPLSQLPEAFWMWHYPSQSGFWMHMEDADYFYPARFVVRDSRMLVALLHYGIQPSRMVTVEEFKYLTEDEIWRYMGSSIEKEGCHDYNGRPLG